MLIKTSMYVSVDSQKASTANVFFKLFMQVLYGTCPRQGSRHDLSCAAPPV